MFMARVEHGQYKFIYKKNHKIQRINKEHRNDHIRIYTIGIVGIHEQEHNIAGESGSCGAYDMKAI
jgi:hypothetical protein